MFQFSLTRLRTHGAMCWLPIFPAPFPGINSTGCPGLACWRGLASGYGPTKSALHLPLQITPMFYIKSISSSIQKQKYHQLAHTNRFAHKCACSYTHASRETQVSIYLYLTLIENKDINIEQSSVLGRGGEGAMYECLLIKNRQPFHCYIL